MTKRTMSCGEGGRRSLPAGNTTLGARFAGGRQTLQRGLPPGSDASKPTSMRPHVPSSILRDLSRVAARDGASASFLPRL